MLGWRTKLVPFVSDEQLGLLLGTQSQTGIEAEHPDCLLAIWPDAISNESTRISDSVWDQMKSVAVDGRPYQLSKDHYHWPIIDEVSRATAFPGGNPEMLETPSQAKKPAIPPQLKDRGLSAQQIIRQRRSAVDMDGRTSITGDTFYLMLARTIPHPEKFPFSVLPWQPKVSLAIFVNRVEGLPTGLYMLVRHPSHRSRLASCLHSEFEWLRPSGCPPELELYLLTTDTPSRVHRSAKVVSCGQDIAADGAFALGMIAEFESTLNDYGPWFYPRLHWVTGLIGQVLYLEAEAAGIRATGIGCFFDDVMHEILGIQDLTWQSLYHFTVGGAVEDSRLKTIPPYAHLT